MGGVVGKVALVALGAAIGANAVEHGQKLARAAAEAVFEAITEAAEAASSYLGALYRAVAAEANDEVKRAVVEAYDAVKRATARVISRIYLLVGRAHGMFAASFAKTELQGVNGLVRAGDVASLVAKIGDGIKRQSLYTFPKLPFGHFPLSESLKARGAASSTVLIMELLGLIFSAGAAGKMLIPTPAKVAISVIAVAAQLAFAVVLA